MTGPLLLSAAVGAGASLLIAFALRSLYPGRSEERRQRAFRSHEDEIWE